MGLFSSFQSEEAKRAEEVRTGAVAPDRSERRKCWEARDAYFGCLDRNVIVDALKDDAKARKACPAENQVFERDCAAAWVRAVFIPPLESHSPSCSRHCALCHYGCSF